MEAHIISIFESMLSGDLEPNIALLTIITVSIYCIYKFMLLHMKKKIDSLPSVVTLQDIIDKKSNLDLDNINDINEKMEILLRRIEIIETLSQIDSKNTDDIKRDLEQIKQILNQFQGHFLYGRNGDEFGNRELK